MFVTVFKLGSFVFLININDLLRFIKDLCEIVWIVDDTSLIFLQTTSTVTTTRLKIHS